jgi:preprotein translocase subunit SecF
MWAYFRNGVMSAAALVALGHDLILTIGIYALVGFTVTPATLIGVLTILGYSLYDTVVVFDKVRENVRDLKSGTARTYSEAANLGLNQVLVRSINTTIIGVLPVAALLFAGAVILGEGPLKDLALALFVGMVAGAYSSIFIATPFLAQLKERDPEMKKLAARVATRRAKDLARSGAAPGSRTSVPTGPAHQPAAAGGTATLVRSEDDPVGDEGEALGAEPSDQELTAGSPSAHSGPTRITVTPHTSGAHAIGVRPLSDGSAKRPQPQHRPRSQRKK